MKVLDPSSQKGTTVADTGTAGFKDGAARAGQVRRMIFTEIALRTENW